jgi:uncharacterized integral membrane protein
MTYEPGTEPVIPSTPGQAFAPSPPPPVGWTAPPSAPPSVPADPPATAAPPSAGLTSRGRVRQTRLSALWIGLIVAAVLLIALLVFIVQNSRTVTIHYLGFDGHVSLAIALVLSAVAGVLLLAIPGTARILQLRRALRKNAAAGRRL